MKILYFSQKKIDLNELGIYPDLINALIDKGHKVTLIYADHSMETQKLPGDRVNIIIVKVANQFGVNLIKKGLIQLRLEKTFIKAIDKYCCNDDFDLIIYATPPVTLANVIVYCKKKYRCKTYLMLKDIFPQNAVDLGMIKTKGVANFIYRFFRRTEKKLYSISDKIGCMSEANIKYIMSHNNVTATQVELFPNSLLVREIEKKNRKVLEQYNCQGRTTFIFGGNMGAPQGLDFLANAINACCDQNAHFFIVGKGAKKDEFFTKLCRNSNVTLLDYLPVKEYNYLCNACDVGVISLDGKFTIPNYPSRILSYMSNAMPIIAVTDTITDVKELLLEKAECGKWSEFGDVGSFVANVKWFCENPDASVKMGNKGRQYFEENFDIKKHIYKIEKMVNEEEI